MSGCSSISVYLLLFDQQYGPMFVGESGGTRNGYDLYPMLVSPWLISMY